jgi:hypothetical protein
LKRRGKGTTLAKKSTFFVVNDKRYTPIELEFNDICSMEMNGVNINDVKSTPMNAIRAYFALYFGGNADIAGAEIMNHLRKHGDLGVLYNALGDSLNDFFRELNVTDEEENPTQSQEETAEKK